MANTILLTASQKEIWQKEVLIEAMEEMFLKQFMGSSKKGNSPISVKADFTKEKGYRMNIPFIPKLSSEGIDGDAELEGNEEEMSQYNFTFDIDQKRNAIRLKGRMDEQKGAYNMRASAKSVLGIWLGEIMEKECFRKLAGLTSYTFSNTPTAPSSTRVVYGNDATSDSDIDSQDKMSLDLLFKLSNTVKTLTPSFKPIRYQGRDWFILLIHPNQRYDLMVDSDYQQLMRDAEVRGKTNPLIYGADAVVDNIIIHVHNYVPTFSTWGSGGAEPGARALLLGAQALALGLAKGSGWEEEGFDYKNKWAIATGRIFGLQKMKFNDVDHAVVAVDTYATSL